MAEGEQPRQPRPIRASKANGIEKLSEIMKI